MPAPLALRKFLEEVSDDDRSQPEPQPASPSEREQPSFVGPDHAGHQEVKRTGQIAVKSAAPMDVCDTADTENDE